MTVTTGHISQWPSSPPARGIARVPGTPRVRGVARAWGTARVPGVGQVRGVARPAGAGWAPGTRPRPQVRVRRAREIGRRVGGTAGLAVAVLLGLGPAVPAGTGGPAPVVTVAPTATVTVVGSGGGVGPLGDQLATGQRLAYRTVPGWDFPAGVQAGATAVAGDGTVLVAGRDHHGGNGPPTADQVVIAAYHPETGAHYQIQVPATGTSATGQRGPQAPSVVGLAPVVGGEAVVFTVGATPDSSTTGTWPVLGILAKVDGQWSVAGQWTAAQLRASGPPWSEQACPEEPGRPGGDCRGLGEVVVLPGSGDIIVAQAGVPGRRNGALMSLRVSGADSGSRFTARITGHYPYPRVTDPRTGSERHLVARHLRADPTGAPGAERFVAGLWEPGEADQQQVIQEFSYDAADGAIAPISAPTLPGDRRSEDAALQGYSAATYDHAGNLWAARHDWLGGGKLAVYPRGEDGAGVLDRPECPFEPTTPMRDYRTGQVWGQSCRPDYDIVQAQELLAVVGMVRAPQGAIVALTIGGVLLPVRASGAGDAMTFQVGNLLETGLALLPAAAEGSREHQLGGFGPAGRLWLAGANAQPDQSQAVAQQWLYGVRVDDLFEPPPVRLPDVPGREVIVQAGHTETTATAQVPGSWAAVDVTSHAHQRGCAQWPSTVDSCSHDAVAGNGFVLGHHSGFGHLAGAVGYPVEVPVAGRYHVAYRVSTFEVTTEAAITLSAGDASHTTPVSTGGAWRTLPQQEPIELPAGVHTIRLAPPEGQGGWYLSWFTLRRA